MYLDLKVEEIFLVLLTVTTRRNGGPSVDDLCLSTTEEICPCRRGGKPEREVEGSTSSLVCASLSLDFRITFIQTQCVD